MRLSQGEKRFRIYSRIQACTLNSSSSMDLLQLIPRSKRLSVPFFSWLHKMILWLLTLNMNSSEFSGRKVSTSTRRLTTPITNRNFRITKASAINKVKLNPPTTVKMFSPASLIFLITLKKNKNWSSYLNDSAAQFHQI